MDRNVNIISGITLSGKSHLLEQILSLPEYQGSVVIRMDDIRKRYWGERDGQSLTPSERVYRNLLTFREIETKLIIDGASTIFVEVPMLTRLHHQQPLVKIIYEAERYVRAIEQERVYMENSSVLERITKVNLNVVLLYCSVATADSRLKRRQNEVNTSNTDIFSLDNFLDITLQFELPDLTTYLPLPLNTSDENLEVQHQRLEEAVSYFHGNSPDVNIIKKRLEEAEYYLEEARSLARQHGFGNSL